MKTGHDFLPADADRIAPFLPRGYSVRVTAETGSTNDDLLHMLRSGETSPTVLAAERQVSGKGRLGRGFESEYGGIYFSFTVSMPASPSAAARITPLSGICAALTLRDIFGLDIRIKWVNDLVLAGKKLAGILAESFFDGDVLRAVVGIGINGVNTRFPDTATSLDAHTDMTVDASLIIGGVVSRFCEQLPEIGSDALIDEYTALCSTIGRALTVHSFDGSPDYTARAVGIDRDCSLLVERGGEVLRLFSGEVSVRNA